MTPAEIVAALRSVQADAEASKGDYYADQFAWHGAGEIADAVEKLAAEIERLREERRWIPVGERVPQDGDRALVYLMGRVMVAERADNCYYRWRDENNHAIYSPSHWMPLPPPPEVEGGLAE